MAIGKIAECAPNLCTDFKRLIGAFVLVIKDSTGSLRKNLAVCVGKLADNEENMRELRRVHGLEIIQSVIEFLDN